MLVVQHLRTSGKEAVNRRYSEFFGAHVESSPVLPDYTFCDVTNSDVARRRTPQPKPMWMSEECTTGFSHFVNQYFLFNFLFLLSFVSLFEEPRLVTRIEKEALFV